MAFCGKCGTQVNEGVKFCPGCGAPMGAQEQQNPNPQQANTQQNGFGAKIAGLNNTEDNTAEHDAKDIADNKTMAVLSYFGPLVLIPILAAPKSKFARYHANQGLVLLIADIAYIILSAVLNMIKITSTETIWGIPYEIKTTPWFISLLIFLIGIPIAILAILGIINAVQGKAKALPLIGKIKILK